MTRVVALRDVVEKSTGTRNPAVKPDDPFTYVDVSAIDNEQKVIAGARQLLGSEAPSRARKLLRSRDVLVSTVRPNLNAVAVVPPELDGQVGSTGFCVLRAVPDKALPEFLFYFVRSRRFVDALSGLVAGALYPAVTDAQVLAQGLSLPSLSEQKCIVDQLSRAEGIVRLRRQAQQKAAELIPAIFVDMFGDPATNPKGWPVVSLGDLLAEPPTLGTMAKPSATAGGWLDLRVANIQGGKLDLRDKKWLDLPAEQVERFALRSGDILLARAIGSLDHLGKAVIVDPPMPWTFDSHLMRLRLMTSRMVPEFFKAFLESKSGREAFLKHTRRSAVQFNINGKEVRQVAIPLPPLLLQKEFVERCRTVAGILGLQGSAAERAEETFQTLLASAFVAEAAGTATREAEEVGS
jgi:type I restriction enzyme S subunit